MELGHLFLGDVDLLERALELLERQEPAFLRFGDQRSQFVDLIDRRLVRKKYLGSDLSNPPYIPIRG